MAHIIALDIARGHQAELREIERRHRFAKAAQSHQDQPIARKIERVHPVLDLRSLIVVR